MDFPSQNGDFPHIPTIKSMAPRDIGIFTAASTGGA